MADTGTITEPKAIPFNAADPVHIALKEDFERFQVAAKTFAESRPDWNARMNAVAEKGLKLDNAAHREILRLAAPEVVYYLADPANEQEARSIMALDRASQVLRIQQLAARKDLVRPTTAASGPASSSGGNVRRSQMDPDAYISMRQKEKAALRRLRGHR